MAQGGWVYLFAVVTRGVTFEWISISCHVFFSPVVGRDHEYGVLAHTVGGKSTRQIGNHLGVVEGVFEGW